MKKEKCLDTIVKAFDFDTFEKIEGHDSAVIGVDLNSMRLIYSVSKIIENLCNTMNERDAVEHFEYKIAIENMSKSAPILCEDYF